MNNTKLIEYVKEHTFLYDVNDRSYTDTQLKDITWNEIAKKLKAPDKQCRKAWFLLRDSFRRAIKKQKLAQRDPAAGPLTTRRWKYEQEMSFLLPYIKERPKVFQFSPYEESDNEENNDTAESLLTSELNVKQESQELPELPEVTQKPKFIYSNEEESQSFALMKMQSFAKPNPIQQFFDSISTTVQTFPPREQVIAKAKVFSIISEMEIDILSRDEHKQSLDSKLLM